MRVCSFTPSATEIIYSLGLQDSLQGVTYDCDYPTEAKSKPIVVLSSLNSGHETSQEIDAKVRKSLSQGRSLYLLDRERFKAADPDIIITQGLCEVCAPSDAIVSEIPDFLGKDPRILSLNPSNVEDIIGDIERVGTILGKGDVAKEITNNLRKRVQKVRAITNQTKRRRIFCMEWLDPIYNTGHWVTDVINLAGGLDELASTVGGESVMVEWDDILDYNPDVLVMMPCGWPISRTISDLESITSRRGFRQLRAVMNDEVFVVDGSAYFSRPGPRIVDSAEILAKILHPKSFRDLILPPGSMQKLQFNSAT